MNWDIIAMTFTCRGTGQQMDHLAFFSVEMAHIKTGKRDRKKKTEVQILYLKSQDEDE